MRTNTQIKIAPLLTHNSGQAERQTPLTELTRAVASCLLFENTYYESGSNIANRIAQLCDKVDISEVVDLARLARNELKLRHVPLFLARQVARINSTNKKYIGITYTEQLLYDIIQRPDEMAEFLSLYWKDNTKVVNGQVVPSKTLSSQVIRGLGKAFTKFNEYQLAKWNRDNEIKLRDVLFLCHAKPNDAEQDALWKRLINNQLAIPDTWEVLISAAKSVQEKKDAWEYLLTNRKLGYIALLMNLRNMSQINVDPNLVEEAIIAGAAKSKALPFRFISASRHAPQYTQILSDAMLKSIEGYRLDGATDVVIDVSGSMDYAISTKSEVPRWHIASALAILIREVCHRCRVFTFSDGLVEVPNLRGIALLDAIGKSQHHNGTNLAHALTELKDRNTKADRAIIITDEQSTDGNIKSWTNKGYIVNVASYQPAVETYDSWTRINGWSDRLIDWISFEETGKILDKSEQED